LKLLSNKQQTQFELKKNFSETKITALWAFSEATFGGILHALSIPFRGIFISGAAVMFIVLIAFGSENKKEILKSTLIVIFIKAIVSPHTPVTAYFSVLLQGLVGSVLFYSKKMFKVSSILLGTVSLFFSGIQKIIVLTLIFGNTLWQSINVFIKQISKEIFSVNLHGNINYGYLLIAVYVIIHIACGIYIGYFATRLPGNILDYQKENPHPEMDDPISFPKREKSKKKNWLLRPTGLIIIFSAIILLIFSYVKPNSLEIGSNEIIVMLIRSVIMTLLWFYIASPLIRHFLNKFLDRKKAGYTAELNEVINNFPHFKKIVSFCWSESVDKKGFKRIKKFLSTTFYNLVIN